MTGESRTLLNKLVRSVPEGLLVDTAWLNKHGYSMQLRHHYVLSGWLEQPARGVFRRPSGELTWQQVVLSLQNLMDATPLIVGGRAALELQGYLHYLRHGASTIHIYGPKPPPSWLTKLKLDSRFIYRKDSRLFCNETHHSGISSLNWNLRTGDVTDLTKMKGGPPPELGAWDWPLTLSTSERAILELLDELPKHESFDEVDALFDGLSNLRPTRLQKLLKDCHSVKVKRLFFFFADRHKHAWRKHLEPSTFDLGSGKRHLVKGGILDPNYQITVPGDLNGLH